MVILQGKLLPVLAFAGATPPHEALCRTRSNQSMTTGVDHVQLVGWVFLEWGHKNQHRTTNVGPSKRSMISHIFFVKGVFSWQMPDHPFCRIFFVKGNVSSKIPDHLWGELLIIFKIIFVKFGMLWSSCRAHMWQHNAHTEKHQLVGVWTRKWCNGLTEKKLCQPTLDIYHITRILVRLQNTGFRRVLTCVSWRLDFRHKALKFWKAHSLFLYRRKVFLTLF